jgi:MFS family permease
LLVDGNHLIAAIVVPMLVAGVGGGAVIAPNTTLTLACVPAGMSGVASGVLQTGQRMGTAVGTAALAAAFHAVVGATGRDAAGLAVALFGAVVLVVFALVVAVVDFRGNSGKNKLENFPARSPAEAFLPVAVAALRTLAAVVSRAAFCRSIPWLRDRRCRAGGRCSSARSRCPWDGEIECENW